MLSVTQESHRLTVGHLGRSWACLSSWWLLPLVLCSRTRSQTGHTCGHSDTCQWVV